MTTTLLILIVSTLFVRTGVALLLNPPFVEVIVPSIPSKSVDVSWYSSFILTVASEQGVAYSADEMQRTFSDRVVRVLEDSTVIKLEKTGLVSLAGIQFPKKYDTGPCPTKTTTTNTKLQQLLPPNTAVRVYTVTEKDARGIRKVLLFRPNNLESSVQTQLLLRGYATVRDIDVATQFSPALAQEWRRAQDQETACRPTVESEYESLRPSSAPVTIPPNPGDSKGCSDFVTYEDALRWYERYFPWYGDVAQLDRDHDGVPCPGLPHTRDAELYRRKVPNHPPHQ